MASSDKILKRLENTKTKMSNVLNEVKDNAFIDGYMAGIDSKEQTNRLNSKNKDKDELYSQVLVNTISEEDEQENILFEKFYNKFREKLASDEAVLEFLANEMKYRLEDKNDSNDSQVKVDTIKEENKDYIITEVEDESKINSTDKPDIIFHDNNGKIYTIEFKNKQKNSDDIIFNYDKTNIFNVIKEYNERRTEYYNLIDNEVNDYSNFKIFSNVKKVLFEQGRTQKWLSTKTNIPQSSLSGILNSTSAPSLEYAYRIARALKKPIEELFEYYDMDFNTDTE